MATKASKYVDNGWPLLEGDDHAVTEIAASRQAPLSPYGDDLPLPVPAESLPYSHPYTVINR